MATAVPCQGRRPAVRRTRRGRGPVLREVWRKHRQWSDAADAAQQSLNRWRLSNLALLVLGALAATFAAQTWLASSAVATLAAVSAAVLAAAGFVQGSMLTSDNTSRWTGARAASEALKAETYRYLAGVKPYAGADRDEHLGPSWTRSRPGQGFARRGAACRPR